MGTLQIKFLFALLSLSLSCSAQLSIDKICINNVKVKSDSTWINTAISQLSRSIYEDEDDEIEEYDFIYYYSGSAEVRLYRKKSRFFPGSISMTNANNILQLGDFKPISPGDTIANFTPELLNIFTSKVYYQVEGKPMPLNKLPDVSADFACRLDDNHVYYITVVFFLQKGVVQRVSLSFAH